MRYQIKCSCFVSSSKDKLKVLFMQIKTKLFYLILYKTDIYKFLLLSLQRTKYLRYGISDKRIM